MSDINESRLKRHAWIDSILPQVSTLLKDLIDENASLRAAIKALKKSEPELTAVQLEGVKSLVLGEPEDQSAYLNRRLAGGRTGRELTSVPFQGPATVSCRFEDERLVITRWDDKEPAGEADWFKVHTPGWYVLRGDRPGRVVVVAVERKLLALE